MNVHSSIIYKSQQVGIMQVSINRLMDNQNEIYTYNKYYSAIKRNEVGSFVEMWMDLESVIQSEVSQQEKN